MTAHFYLGRCDTRQLIFQWEQDEFIFLGV